MPEPINAAPAAFTRKALKALDTEYEARMAGIESIPDAEVRQQFSAEIDQLAWMRACAIFYQEHGTWAEVLAYLAEGNSLEEQGGVQAA